MTFGTKLPIMHRTFQSSYKSNQTFETKPKLQPSKEKEKATTIVLFIAECGFRVKCQQISNRSSLLMTCALITSNCGLNALMPIEPNVSVSYMCEVLRVSVWDTDACFIIAYANGNPVWSDLIMVNPYLINAIRQRVSAGSWELKF